MYLLEITAFVSMIHYIRSKIVLLWLSQTTKSSSNTVKQQQSIYFGSGCDCFIKTSSMCCKKHTKLIHIKAQLQLIRKAMIITSFIQFFHSRMRQCQAFLHILCLQIICQDKLFKR